jgi:hypothetical protein
MRLTRPTPSQAASSFTNTAQPSASNTQQQTTGFIAAPVSNCGLLGSDASITSPAAYLQHWRSAVKPRLEAIWATVLKTSNPERLLFALDALLMQLRSSRSLAVHLQQQHEDPAWVKAAAQVGGPIDF